MNYKLECRKIDEMCLPPTQEPNIDIAQSLFQMFGEPNSCSRCKRPVNGWFYTTIKCRECESIL